jgi:hypothetical protein
MQRWRTRIAVRSTDVSAVRFVFTGGPTRGGASQASLMADYAVNTLGVPRGECRARRVRTNDLGEHRLLDPTHRAGAVDKDRVQHLPCPQSTQVPREAVATAGSPSPSCPRLRSRRTRFGSLRSTFDLDAVAVLRRTADGWEVEATAGQTRLDNPERAAYSVELDRDRVLALDRSYGRFRGPLPC